MKRGIEGLLVLVLMMLSLTAASCFGSGEMYVGYGYTHNYYDDVFYTPPMDRYGYGFYGHP